MAHRNGPSRNLTIFIYHFVGRLKEIFGKICFTPFFQLIVFIVEFGFYFIDANDSASGSEVFNFIPKAKGDIQRIVCSMGLNEKVAIDYVHCHQICSEKKVLKVSPFKLVSLYASLYRSWPEFTALLIWTA